MTLTHRGRSSYTAAFETTSPMLRWNDVSESTFYQEAHRISVLWLKGFVFTDTRIREVGITNIEDWREFSESCYLPVYKQGDWSTPNAENWNLQEYAKFNPTTLSYANEILILSAYHTLLKKRIIIDGAHRAVELESNLGKKLEEARIIECYGSQLHSIFPCDFNNMIVRAIKSSNSPTSSRTSESVTR